MARLLSGTATVTSAGTAVRISNTPRRVLGITLKGRVGNTGNTYVGDVNVSSSDGMEMQPNESVPLGPHAAFSSLPIKDIYVDAATSGDKVDWIAVMFT